MRILIPTDFTDSSEFALGMALKISSRIPVELHLMHVLQQSVDLNLDSAGNVLEDGEIDYSEFKQLKVQAEKEMETAKKENHLIIDTHLMVGNITDCILDKALQIEADLILMGTRGVYRKRGVLRGIETQYVVRKSPVPVLTVMCDRSLQAFDRLVYVSDFKQKEMHRTEIIRKFQMAFEMKLTLLYISNRSESESSKDAIRKRMKEFAEFHHLATEQYELFTDFTVQEGVNHFVQMRDTDLVCLATHGRPGWLKIFWPSIAEHISTHIYKPVLTYHLKRA